MFPLPGMPDVTTMDGCDGDAPFRPLSAPSLWWKRKDDMALSNCREWKALNAAAIPSARLSSAGHQSSHHPVSPAQHKLPILSNDQHWTRLFA